MFEHVGTSETPVGNCKPSIFVWLYSLRFSEKNAGVPQFESARRARKRHSSDQQLPGWKCRAEMEIPSCSKMKGNHFFAQRFYCPLLILRLSASLLFCFSASLPFLPCPSLLLCFSTFLRFAILLTFLLWFRCGCLFCSSQLSRLFFLFSSLFFFNKSKS